MNEHIVLDTCHDILRIEIRRPAKKNALTASMYAALAEALDGADNDNAVRVVLIHGQPACFTAGNDLVDFLNDPPVGDNPPVFNFLRSLRTLEKPLIAAVTGIAVGVGTTLLLHCDLAYCDVGARFQLPFVNLGLCPEAASSLLLPRLAGHARAAEMLMLGEMFDAATAHEIGLVNEVLAHDQVMARANERARQLSEQPAVALRTTKQLLKAAGAESVRLAMDTEAAHFRKLLNSPEAKEAFAAFIEKRKPDFSGLR